MRSVSPGSTIMVVVQPALGTTPTPGDGSTFPHVPVMDAVATRAASRPRRQRRQTTRSSTIVDLAAWRVSENAGGADLNGSSGDPRLSHDGAVIVFMTAASDASPLVQPGSSLPAAIAPNTGLTHVLIKVAASGVYEWISAPASGVQPNGSASQPVVSSDGRWVAFQSTASNLTPAVGDRNGSIADVFVRDRVTGALVPISVTRLARALTLTVAAGDSGNGRYVTFESAASNLLTSSDLGKAVDIFVRDRDTDADGLYDEPGASQTLRISQNALGAGARSGCGYSAISDDGRFVAFTTASTNLDPCDTSAGFLDFFVCDRDLNGDGIFDQPGDTRLSVASENALGVQANAKCGGNCFRRPLRGLQLPGRQPDPVGHQRRHSPTATNEYGRDIFLIPVLLSVGRAPRHSAASRGS